MTTRDKLGLAVLIALFVLMGAALIWMLRGTPHETFPPSESPIVKQRIINIEKSE